MGTARFSDDSKGDAVAQITKWGQRLAEISGQFCSKPAFGLGAEAAIW
ncbi:hypothetical protein MTsPCn3_05020 [Erythrobacter sp. MTPC3]